MAICGYNDKIGKGLTILVEGMIEALEKKAEAASVSEVFVREMVELNTMIATMQKAQGSTLPEMFVGLNFLAKALFERVQRQLNDAKGGETIASECRAVGEEFIDLLSRTEKRHEVLRSTSGKDVPAEELARELAEWVVMQSEVRKAERESVLV